jgi:hypothetical protein
MGSTIATRHQEEEHLHQRLLSPLQQARLPQAGRRQDALSLHGPAYR